MITEKGKLPVGVEKDGKLHVDFEMRPRLVKDSVDAWEDERARTNDSYEGLVMTCKQIIKLGELSQDEITPDLLLEMYDLDMQEIMAASRRLEVRLENFRKEAKKPSKTDAGSHESGVQS